MGPIPIQPWATLSLGSPLLRDRRPCRYVLSPSLRPLWQHLIVFFLHASDLAGVLVVRAAIDRPSLSALAIGMHLGPKPSSDLCPFPQ